MKNEFDDILKKRWEEIHFPVDDKHREEMIHLLDQPKRRKGVFFWWFGGIVMTAGLAALLLQLNQKSDILIPGSPVNHLSTIEVKTEQSNSNTHFSDDESENEKVNIHNEMNLQGSSGSEVQIKQNLIESKEKINSKSDNEKISVPKTRKPIIASGSTNIPNVPEKILPIEPEFVQMENSIQNQAAFEEEATSGNTVIDPSIQLRNDYITLPIEFALISDLDFSRDILFLSAPTFKSSRSFNLFAEGGLSYIPASFPDIKSGWSLRAGGGMNYAIFSKTHFIWTAGYMFQKDGFSFERSSTVDQPGFGARSNFHTLTADKLHFVYSKLGIQHHLRRHILSAFAGVQWLYGAQGTVVIQTQQQLPSVSTESTQYAWLNLNGMQRFLWSGEINYGYQLSQRISMHVGIRHYFTSLKAEDSDLADEGYYWKGKFASINPSFTINYRLYGK